MTSLPYRSVIPTLPIAVLLYWKWRIVLEIVHNYSIHRAVLGKTPSGKEKKDSTHNWGKKWFLQATPPISPQHPQFLNHPWWFHSFSHLILDLFSETLLFSSELSPAVKNVMPKLITPSRTWLISIIINTPEWGWQFYLMITC